MARSLDAILTVNTLYFWPDPAAGLAELYRVLGPGGQVAIATVTKATMQSLPFVTQRFTLYDDTEIATLVENAGFDVDQVPVGDSPGRITVGVKPA